MLLHSKLRSSCIVLAVTLFACVGTGRAQSMEAYYPDAPVLEGHWEGAVVDGGAVRNVRIDLIQEDDGLSGRLDIPELGLAGWRMSVDQQGDTLSFDAFGENHLLFDRERAELRGIARLSEDRELPMHLYRVAGPTSGFSEEEVRYSVGDITIGGMMLVPDGPGRHPAVVFVHGRGYGTRWSLYETARMLASRGIAAFITDGPGTGASTGDRTTTTDAFRYADTHAALAYVRGRHDIRKNEIGLFTGSAGAWVGPRVAVESGHVAFLIMSVGPAESLADQQGHVIEYLMRWSDEEYSDDELQEAFAYQSSLVEMSARGAEWSEFAPLVAEARQKRWAGHVDLPDDMSNAELDYFRRRPTYDPVPYFRRLSIPVLALYGEDDFVVPPQANVPKLKAYLEEAKNQDFKIVVFPDVGHGLRLEAHRRDGAAWPEQRYEWSRRTPAFEQTVLDWLLPRVTTTSSEKEAVHAAVLDYVKALYDVEPDRVARSVHPSMRKLGFYRANAEETYRDAPMTYEQLHSLAGSWNEGNRQQIDPETIQKIEVLDVLDQTATAKLVAQWGIDYMHLAKFDGQWQIVNVLWQSHPAE